MNEKIIITAGQSYCDIDVLACALGVNELMEIQKIDSEVVLPGVFNKSITPTAKSWSIGKYKKELEGAPGQFVYIIVDVSDPKYFAEFVVEKNIIEIFDHRFGFEEYWNKKLGYQSHIDLIGSCATLVWEKFNTLDLSSYVSVTNANLLYTAIISNTLNLNSQNTTGRDLMAIKQLSEYTNLPDNWDELYFSEMSSSVYGDPVNAMKNDTNYTDISGMTYAIIQTELWDSGTFVNENLDIILSLLRGLKADRKFFTAPSISEGFNYLVTEDFNLKQTLSKIIGADFGENTDIGKTNALWLRKEIIKKLREMF